MESHQPLFPWTVIVNPIKFNPVAWEAVELPLVVFGETTTANAFEEYLRGKVIEVPVPATLPHCYDWQIANHHFALPWSESPIITEAPPLCLVKAWPLRYEFPLRCTYACIFRWNIAVTDRGILKVVKPSLVVEARNPHCYLPALIKNASFDECAVL